jgi:hypothetical protein
MLVQILNDPEFWKDEDEEDEEFKFGEGQPTDNTGDETEEEEIEEDAEDDTNDVPDPISRRTRARLPLTDSEVEELASKLSFIILFESFPLCLTFLFL